MSETVRHLPHLLLLLHAVERQRGATAAEPAPQVPSSVFLALDEGDFFWELVACRVRGYPSLLFGGLRFRRQERDGFSRQSLVSYLSAPVREVALDRTPRPEHLIELLVPDSSETIGQFLDRVRRGVACRKVLIDRHEIELAFDFRLENPSRSRPAGTAARPDLHVFRTTTGHVLSAYPHQLPAKLLRNDDFVGLTRPTQHSATADRTLPTLVVHRGYLSMAARVETGGTERFLQHTPPFQPALANARHLLDPQLESYRLFRERMLRDELTRPESDETVTRAFPAEVRRTA